MTLKADSTGLLIPSSLLNGAVEFDLQRQGDQLVAVPVEPARDESPTPKKVSIYDPVHGLGGNPITLGVTDASTRLDGYVYGDPHREHS